ncbi:MAG: hypothetical protein VX278_01000, partial [Myxococcota bacterium]|nr:hypothetical protein [Myxococcota bacterium]
MISNGVFIQVPLDAMYPFVGGSAMLLLVIYCLSHPSRSAEKRALIHWLSLWSLFLFLQCACFTDLYNRGLEVSAYIPESEPISPRGIIWIQIIFTSFVWFGYVGLRFSLMFLKRKEPITIRIALLSVVGMLFGVWFFPNTLDQREPISLIYSFMIV